MEQAPKTPESEPNEAMYWDEYIRVVNEQDRLLRDLDAVIAGRDTSKVKIQASQEVETKIDKLAEKAEKAFRSWRNAIEQAKRQKK